MSDISQSVERAKRIRQIELANYRQRMLERSRETRLKEASRPAKTRPRRTPVYAPIGRRDVVYLPPSHPGEDPTLDKLKETYGRLRREYKEKFHEEPEARFKGPKRGSIGHKMQEAVSKTLDAEEKLFTDIGTKLQKSVGYHRALAEEAKERRDPLGTVFHRASGDIIKATSGAVVGASFLIRPRVIQRTPEAVYNLLTDPDTQATVATRFMGDPVGEMSYLIGGYIGGSLAGKAIGKVAHKIRQRRVDKFLTEFPEEDFLPFEEQYRFPESVSAQEEVWNLRKQDAFMVDESLGEGFLDSHQVGFGTKKIATKKDFPLLDLRPRSQWKEFGYKFGYRRTGAGLIPELLPEGVGKPTTVYIPTRTIFDVTEHIEGLDVSLPTLTVPHTDYSSLIGGLGMASLLDTRVRKDVEERVSAVSTTKVTDILDPHYRVDWKNLISEIPTEIEDTIIEDILLEETAEDIITITTTKTVHDTILEEIQILDLPLPPAPVIPILERPSSKPRKPRKTPTKEKGTKRKRTVFEEIWGETRKYPVSGLQKFLRSLMK